MEVTSTFEVFCKADDSVLKERMDCILEVVAELEELVSVSFLELERFDSDAICSAISRNAMQSASSFCFSANLLFSSSLLLASSRL